MNTASSPMRYHRVFLPVVIRPSSVAFRRRYLSTAHSFKIHSLDGKSAAGQPFGNSKGRASTLMFGYRRASRIPTAAVPSAVSSRAAITVTSMRVMEALGALLDIDQLILMTRQPYDVSMNQTLLVGVPSSRPLFSHSDVHDRQSGPWKQPFRFRPNPVVQCVRERS